MTQHLLAQLAQSGVLERAGGTATSYLRVTPRFLAHAEGTAGRLRVMTGHDDVHASLEASLATWDEYRGQTHLGALFLRDLLEEKGQLGRLRAIFPTLERFAAAGA